MSEQTLALLQGKRILVTRTREQASVFSQRLRALGAEPIEFPTIRIVPPEDWREMDRALLRLARATEKPYTWVVFTSANGVTISLQRLQQLGYAPHVLRNTRIATIGPATAAALANYGLHADLVPDDYIAESVASGLIEDASRRGSTLAGQEILLARAAEARKVLVSQLQQAGAIVDEVAAYYTETVARDDAQGQMVLHLLQEGLLDILTFTSSSTVRNFMSWLKSCEQGETESAGRLLMHAKVACIGPITAQTARELGLHIDIEASEFTIAGLTEAIVSYYKEKSHD
ncbi:MAG TPA: uroporphyrinogen-III synthase [Ktedonobacteraceae bacterium]|jgi:uroporphyrinogen-III synthase